MNEQINNTEQYPFMDEDQKAVMAGAVFIALLMGLMIGVTVMNAID